MREHETARNVILEVPENTIATATLSGQVATGACEAFRKSAYLKVMIDKLNAMAKDGYPFVKVVPRVTEET